MELLTRYQAALASLLALLCLLLGFHAPSAWAATPGSYEAELPAELATSPNLCAYVPCHEVITGADSFSERMGKPPYVEAFKTREGKKEKIGYVFLSTDIVDIPAYSGKPVVTLIGMDTAGHITGAKVLKHSEPILLLGIPESQLIKFIHQYIGKFIGGKIEVGSSREGVIGVDAISGATVTVIAQNQVMLRSGMAVAKQVGIIKPAERPVIKFTKANAPLSWNELVEEEAIGHLRVTMNDVGLGGRDPFMDIYFGSLNAPPRRGCF